MSGTQGTEQIQLFEAGRQLTAMTFDGGLVICYVGLLPISRISE